MVASSDEIKERNMNYKKILFFCILFIVCGHFTGYAQIYRESNKSKIRYIIVNTEKSKDSIDIEILLQKEQFSKDTLIKLFKIIRNRFPKPKLLDIRVFTDLRDVMTPEERNMPKISESKEIIVDYGNQAVFTIEGQKGHFYIYFQNGDEPEEVEIK
jgi:hypothetical protein